MLLYTFVWRAATVKRTLTFLQSEVTKLCLQIIACPQFFNFDFVIGRLAIEIIVFTVCVLVYMDMIINEKCVGLKVTACEKIRWPKQNTCKR